MKISAIFLLILIGTLSASAKHKNSNNKKDKPVKVSYLVSNEYERKNDLVTITMMFKVSDPSLEEAHEEANELIEEIKEIMQDYCEDYKDEDERCSDLFETENFQIQPIYQRLKGQQTFQCFYLTFEVVIHVRTTENIGDLVDRLVIKKRAIIKSMNWEDLMVEAEENLLEKGRDQGEETCRNLGLELKKIQNVEIVEAEKVSKALSKKSSGEEGEQEEEQETKGDSEEGVIELKVSDNKQKYRFEVLCS